MRKRFLLWGGISATVLLVAAVMVYFAGRQTDVSTSGSAIAAGNSQEYDVALLEPRQNDHAKGNPEAGVVIVKYSDFQCPACRFYASMDDYLSREMADDVLFVFRYFPLRSFQFGYLSARYAEAAGRQGQFWRMHDLMYINQHRWSQGDAEQIFQQFAESMELDMDQLDQDLEDPALMERIEADYEEGRRLGVRAVPTIFVNGEQIAGPRSVEEYQELIESRL